MRLSSPNGKIKFSLVLDKNSPVYSVAFNKQTLIQDSPLTLTFDNGAFGENVKINKPVFSTKEETYELIGQQRSFSIKGVVKDASSGQPIPFANVVVWNTTQGAVTDSTGLFEISGISPGSYRLQSSFLGYKPFVTAEFRLANKDIFFPIELEEASQNLQEVSVVASPFRKTAESPLGLRVIGFKEIEKAREETGISPG